MAFDPLTHCTEHLSWEELACHDPGRTPYPLAWRADRAVALGALFDTIRTACGDAPLRVLSGYRTPEWNRSRHVGGAPNSQHVEGRALDLAPPDGWTVLGFYRVVAAVHRVGGLGVYEAAGFVHVDIRPGTRQARWNGRNQRKEARPVALEGDRV